MDHTALPESPQRLECKSDAGRHPQHLRNSRHPQHTRLAPPGRPASRFRLTYSLLLPLLLPLLTTACSSTRPTLRPSSLRTAGSVERGVASWYGPGFDGRRTASGERYKRTALTAAHRSLPFGTRVQVKNRDNGTSVVVTINDRGPFARGRVIDLSYQAARELGVAISGTADVELAILGAGGAEANTPSSPETRYTVQVGAFSDPDYAVLLHRDLKRLYPEAYVHSDGIWNRVRVGLFDDRENAENLSRELAAMGMSSVVVAAAH
jgi:rare lipoprotein A